MLGNKISFKSNFNFKSFFLDSEVKVFEEFLKNYFKLHIYILVNAYSFLNIPVIMYMKI